MKIFCASHGKLASGIKSSIDILLGKSEQLFTFDAYIDDDKSLNTELEIFLNSLEEDEKVIFLSDIFGGSVNQVLAKKINSKNHYLICGMNLPLVIELMIFSQLDFDESRLKEIVESAQNSIKFVNMEEQPSIEEDELF